MSPAADPVRHGIAREDAAWLAGLLDGEGCFDSPGGNPRIRVKMTDLDVVLRAATVMDAITYGEVDPRPTVDGKARSPLLIAQTTGTNAARVMRAILPWLGARRSLKVTSILLAHAETRRGKKPLRAVA